jgi:quinol monooxygenase YgiN
MNKTFRPLTTARIMIIAALTLTASLTLYISRAEQAGITPVNKNRKEPTPMPNEKVIMLIEAKIQPPHRAELIEAARQYLPLVRAEPGVEAFYLTARQDDPNTFVFYEIYKSKAAQDFHLQQDFTKKFLATLKSAQAGDRVRTNLVELAEEARTASN